MNAAIATPVNAAKHAPTPVPSGAPPGVPKTGHAAAAPAPALAQRLPPLRQDLQLHEAATQPDGSPAWTVQDPVGNQFYRIGWLEFELLARWHLGDPAQVLAATARETTLAAGANELAALYEFLLTHGLLQVHDARYTQWLVERHARAHLSRARWLLHHYLFFRVPLLHPAAWLGRALPLTDWVFHRGTALAVLAAGVLGLALTARRWDEFQTGFVDTLTLGGLGGYLVALALTKSLHEFGHAITATRAGLRVAHMGLAFVVMWPMLYTDTGEIWRLKNHRARLAIAGAGLVAELALAALATLAWHLAPEGAVKQCLFYLATTAWLTSLALNANPFMRFDGYYIASDILDLPNLHERSFALARAALRRTLWGWDESDPERFTPARRRALVAFALATWVYRLGVFAGIAAAVYLFFFKLLGLLLFAVELWWFIWLPIQRELKVVHQRRGETPRGRRFLWAGLVGAALLAALWPWSGQVSAPGWARPAQVHVFYSPLPARLSTSAPAAAAHPVAAGEVAFELDQPDLGYRATLGSVASAALEQRLRGLAGEEQGEARRAQITQLRSQRQAEWHAQLAEANRLVLRAPFAGVLTDVDPELARGVWVTSRQPLAALVDPTQWLAEVFVSQHDRARLHEGDAVRFYPEGRATAAPLVGRVLAIDSTRTAVLPHPLLSTRHGGQVPVLADTVGLMPRDALYRVRIQLSDQAPRLQVLRGQAVIEGQARSWASEWLEPARVLVMRELSF